MRNALSTVPKAARQMEAATPRTIFAQLDREGACEAIARISRLFERRFPKLVAVLQEAEVDILAFHTFPLEHRRQIWSTNALERLNREVGRRCEVVGVFPNRSSPQRLVGAVLEEQNDESAVGRRYISQESMNNCSNPHPGGGPSAARAADRIITVEPHAGFYTISRDVTAATPPTDGIGCALSVMRRNFRKVALVGAVWLSSLKSLNDTQRRTFFTAGRSG